ncbi:MAG: hypothetical protein D6791_16620 [Chloroflexi bacterium]|nr:MAG: hypothetical protein D6791_16620 [Chloroflexota bacterium]
MFFKGSRYENVAEHTITDANGREIRYKKVRFIPSISARAGCVVRQGDRPDLIAHRYYQDPERFWRLCDANKVMWPPDLVAEIGAVILIPPAED